MSQKQPRMVDAGFLAWLRQKPCCVCGRAAPSEAAHLRMGNLDIGKRHVGMAEKPSDFWATPLCVWCHRAGMESQHALGEEQFWKLAGINPFALAIKLYAEFGGAGGTVRKRQKANMPKRAFPKTARKMQSRSSFR
jgi:hypothetical protein